MLCLDHVLDKELFYRFETQVLTGIPELNNKHWTGKLKDFFVKSIEIYFVDSFYKKESIFYSQI